MKEPDSATAFLHLFALSAFACLAPVLDIVGRSPEFLVAHHARPLDAGVLVALLAVVPPLLLLGLTLAGRAAGAAFGRAVFALSIAGLAALVAMPLMRRAESVPGDVQLAGAALAGLLFAGAYTRFAALRSVLTILAAAPFVFAGVFLSKVGVRAAVFSSDPAPGPGVSPRSPVPIVMVVLDELPLMSVTGGGTSIDAARLPNFARLARSATWYRNATSVANDTQLAVPAILTGRYPSEGALPVLRDHPDNLFTLLGPAYEIHAVEPLTRLCPERLNSLRAGDRAASRLRLLLTDLAIVYPHMVLPAALTHRLPAVTQNWVGFAGPAGRSAEEPAGALGAGATDRLGTFRRFVEEIRPSARPTLHFLHVLLPHVPWQYLPTGQEYDLTPGQLPGLATEMWSRDVERVRRGYQRHLLQLGLVDRLLGALLDRLESQRVYDDTLLIVVADHGASFRPGESRRFVDHRNWQDIASVPLFVKYPRQRGGSVSDRNVETVDLLPTVASVVQAAGLGRVDGESLRETGSAERPEKVVQALEGGGRRFGFPPAVDGSGGSAREMWSVFTRGSTDVFRLGPRPDLIGRRLSELPDGTSLTEAAADLDAAFLYRSVSVRGEFIPAHVTGSLREGERKRTLAIAVNGVIRATTTTYLEASAQRFASMVPPEAFHDGANEVRVLAIGRASSARTVPAVDGAAAAAVYSLDGDRLQRSGRALSPARGEIAGCLEEASMEGRQLSARGWAADVSSRARVAEVVLFAGGAHLFTGRPGVERSDIAGLVGCDEAGGLGFDYRFPMPTSQDPTPVRVRVFAVSSRQAFWEIPNCARPAGGN